MDNENRKKVKPHILLIGLALVAFNSYWCLMGSEVWHSTQLTIASLFFNAVFTLFVLVLINLLLQRFASRLAMSQADLQTLYVMVVMLTTISGHTMMGYLIPALAHVFQFASAENEWIPLLDITCQPGSLSRIPVCWQVSMKATLPSTPLGR